MSTERAPGSNPGPPPGPGEGLPLTGQRSSAELLRNGMLALSENQPVGYFEQTAEPFPADNLIHIFSRSVGEDGTNVLTHEVVDSAYMTARPTQLLVDNGGGFFLVANYEDAKRSARGEIEPTPLEDEDAVLDICVNQLAQALALREKGYLPAIPEHMRFCAEYLQLLNSILPDGEFDIHASLKTEDDRPENSGEYIEVPFLVSSFNDGSGHRGIGVRYKWDRLEGPPIERRVYPYLPGLGSPGVTLTAQDFYLISPEGGDPDEFRAVLAPMSRPIGHNEVGRLQRVLSGIHDETLVSVEGHEEPIELREVLAQFTDSTESRAFDALLYPETDISVAELESLIKSTRQYLETADRASLTAVPPTKQTYGDILTATMHIPGATSATEQVEPPTGEVIEQPELNIFGHSGPAQLTVTEFIPGTMQIAVDWAPEEGEIVGGTLIVRTDGNATYEFHSTGVKEGEAAPDNLPALISPDLYRICTSRFPQASHSLLFDSMRPAERSTVTALDLFVSQSAALV